MGYEKDEEDRLHWRRRKQPKVLDWLSWWWDRWRILYFALALLVLYFFYSTIRGAFSGDDFSGKKLGFLALCVSMLGAFAGIGNFILSRFRVVGVHEIRTTYKPDEQGKYFREFQCDVRAYGSPIHDLSVRVEIFIPPTPEAVRRNVDPGSHWFSLEPVGELRNPLNAGQGQYFVLTDKHKRPAPPRKGYAFSDEIGFNDDRYMTNLLGLAKLKDISLCVYCAEKRKRLRVIRSHAFHHAFSSLNGNKLKIRYSRLKGWWFKFQIWRTQRLNAKLQRAEKEANSRPQGDPEID